MPIIKFQSQHCCLTIKQNVIRLFCITLIIILIRLYIMKSKLVPPTDFIHPTNQTTRHKSNISCIVYMQAAEGRFANRMFLLASAYGLARLHSCSLHVKSEIINELKSVFILDLSPLLISSATFFSVTNDSSQPMKRISKYVVCDYVTELTRPNAIPSRSIFEIKGYWQSYLHFAKYADEFRQRIFVATHSVLERVSKFFDELNQQKFGFKLQFSFKDHQSFKSLLSQSNWTTWIGIHVRRTDFVSMDFSSSDAYLLWATRFYTSRYRNAHFIVTSDDRAYCKRLFRRNINVFLTPASFSLGDDLITLSLCQHSIVTGGTFGWWSGYLANGEVIHDKMYPSGCERREYYYPPWFLINGNVRAHRNTAYVL